MARPEKANWLDEVIARTAPGLAPEPQMSVAGIVVNKLTQKPLEGALVWHTLRDPNGAARGDEQSRFALTGALSHGQTYLYVVAPGYVSQRMITGTPTGNIRFKLTAGSSVAGTVTDSKGTPVERAAPMSHYRQSPPHSAGTA